MTISTSNEQLAAQPRVEAVAAPSQPPPPPASSVPGPPPRTLWSRFIILALCMALVLSALAFGTVHAWSLAVFQGGAALVVALWMMDAWRSRTLRFSRNLLQLPLLGLIVLGFIQLMPLGAGGSGDIGAGLLTTEPVRSLSFDPYATRVVIIQLLALLVYFAAALAFIDTPRRLRLITRTVIIFGFVLALFGLMQHFLNPYVIYWLREPKQAQPFGPFINRHHFAGYMELVLALPLGLLFSGAVERDRVPLYAFASVLMCIALVMTNSRGGIVSMLAEILFLFIITASIGRRRGGDKEEDAVDGRSRLRAAATRAGLGFAMILAVFMLVLYFGGEESLSRFVGTVNAQDPTTGRAHFWKGTVALIKDHPLTGVGLGAFSAVYPRYDTGSSGLYRLEQAHNDYLQILSDGGIVGGALGLIFLAALFLTAFRRMATHDKFRRGVALGALAGCAGVLVHSFFDFTLHTTANALLFLFLAALATVNGRVEEPDTSRRRHRRRRRRSTAGEDAAPLSEEQTQEQAAA
ncbi:MAG: O-antigen ligase family protein [Acidobacteria bacterium]|nr:O-antigen ligase family protein [Acidobacteriota bacterium]